MKLHAIIIGSEAQNPLHYVETAEVIAGSGIIGDRYYYGKGTFNKPQLSQQVREISILPFATLAECNSRLGSNLDFLDLRRNLIIEDFDYDLLKGRTFTIGTAQLRIVRTCPPCRYLSRLLGEDMMQGLKYIGGYRATIVQSGIIRIGDSVQPALMV